MVAKRSRADEAKNRAISEKVTTSRLLKRVKATETEPRKHEQYSWDKMREFEPSLNDKDEVNKIEEERAISQDEFSTIIGGENKPKILITTGPKPKRTIFPYVAEFMELFPNLFFYKREKYTLRNICKWAFDKNFTHVLVLTERLKKPHRLMICFKNGPTAYFKVLRFKKIGEIRHRGARSNHTPEILLNGFKSPLGSRFSRVLSSMFEQKKQTEDFVGRNVVTFHNQRDYIFVRSHRYIFNEKFDGVKLQELGPRFTLKPVWLMNGKFDAQHANFEYFYKRKEMRSKKRYFL